MPLLTMENATPTEGQQNLKLVSLSGVQLDSLSKIEFLVDQMGTTNNHLKNLSEAIQKFLDLSPEQQTCGKLRRLLKKIKNILPSESILPGQITVIEFMISNTMYDELISNLKEIYVDVDQIKSALDGLKRKFEALKVQFDRARKDAATILYNLYVDGSVIGIIKETGALEKKDQAIQSHRKIDLYNNIAKGESSPEPREELIISAHNWYEAIRLFCWRTLRELSLVLPQAFFWVAACFAFKAVMAVLSVFYIIGVVAVIVDVYKLSFRNDGIFDWQLFYNIWQENGYRRLFSLLNDLVWAAVNSLVCLSTWGHPVIKEPGYVWSAVSNANEAIDDDINLIGFVLDVPNDGMAAKLKAELPVDSSSAGSTEELCRYLIKNIENTKSDKGYRFKRALGIAFLILIGMVVLYHASAIAAFLLTAESTVKIVGSSFALGGSLIGGFGARIRDTETYKNFMENVGDFFNRLYCRMARGVQSICGFFNSLSYHSLRPVAPSGYTPLLAGSPTRSIRRRLSLSINTNDRRPPTTPPPDSPPSRINESPPFSLTPMAKRPSHHSSDNFLISPRASSPRPGQIH